VHFDIKHWSNRDRQITLKHLNQTLGESAPPNRAREEYGKQTPITTTVKEVKDGVNQLMGEKYGKQ
jgi:cAMP phosphodiesterase